MSIDIAVVDGQDEYNELENAWLSRLYWYKLSHSGRRSTRSTADRIVNKALAHRIL